MNLPSFPMRQVHLDFHTAPEIPDVGADWDAEHFTATLQRARVNSITVFAKCHHGMNYYPTKIGPVHPALTFDLLGAQIEACHTAGIRCPICWSCGAIPPVLATSHIRASFSKRMCEVASTRRRVCRRHTSSPVAMPQPILPDEQPMVATQS